MKPFVAGIWTLLFPFYLFAQGEKPPGILERFPEVTSQPVWTFYFENDSQWLKHHKFDDRWYTHGTGLSVASRDWGRSLTPHMPFAEAFGEPDQTAAGFIVGQLIFTPEDIKTPVPDPADRPYAGYLYLGAYWQRAKGDTMDHFQVEVGTTGPHSLADEAQKWVHDLFTTTEPRGWDEQIDNEFTFQTWVWKTWRHRLEDEAGGLQADMLPQVGAGLGTVQCSAEAGATFRIGHNLPDDFGPGRLVHPGDLTGRAGKGFSVYAFFRATGRGVAHNIFLDGTLSDGSPSVDPEPWFGELQGGFSFSRRDQDAVMEFTYSQTYQSREFRGQPHDHSFGAMTISFTWWN